MPWSERQSLQGSNRKAPRNWVFVIWYTAAPEQARRCFDGRECLLQINTVKCPWSILVWRRLAIAAEQSSGLMP